MAESRLESDGGGDVVRVSLEDIGQRVAIDDSGPVAFDTTIAELAASLRGVLQDCMPIRPGGPLTEAELVAHFGLDRSVIGKVIQVFQPGAIVMQCGADSLSGDRLGCFNLSLKGHADCVAYVRSFDIPVLVLGGGGYTLRNVPRVWTYETAVLLGTDIKDVLPYNDYFEYYGPDYRLHMPVSNMENLNSAEYLDHIKNQLFDVLSHVDPAPGVQIKADPAVAGGGATGLPAPPVLVGAGMVAVDDPGGAAAA
ncbi:MAG: hypothetical protein AAFS11_05665, partial [Planctomycetota bacterium]